MDQTRVSSPSPQTTVTANHRHLLIDAWVKFISRLEITILNVKLNGRDVNFANLNEIGTHSHKQTAQVLLTVDDGDEPLLSYLDECGAVSVICIIYCSAMTTAN